MPYGMPRLEPGIGETDFAFTGQRSLDPVSLMDYTARAYMPALLRFASANSIGDGNRYSYVFNNPTNYVDPSGHMACLDLDCHILWSAPRNRIMTRNSGPTELDINKLRKEVGPSDISGYGYYFQYLETWAATPGKRPYSIWRHMTLTLAREYELIEDPSFLGEGEARALGEWCEKSSAPMAAPTQIPDKRICGI